MNPTVPQTGHARLLPLGDGPFRLWPHAVLRSAGFPFADLLALADEPYLAAVDTAIDAGADRVDAGVSSAAATRQFTTLRAIAGLPLLREAVAWQNHTVVEMLDSLAAAPDDVKRNQWLSRRERIVARYYARYCGKNDTIGFTGPAAWLRLTGDQADPVAVTPGPGLETRRRVYNENWAIEALAAAAVRDPALRRRVPPRRHPAYLLLGTMLLRTDAMPEMLTPTEAAVLSVCDGHTEVSAITTLLAGTAPGLDTEDEVWAVVDDLAERTFLRVDLEPPLLPYPEVSVLAALERSRPESEPALAMFDRWRAATDRVAAATPDRLVEALEDLATLFTELTGLPPQRREGVTYGGRGLIYLDTDRDLDGSLGTSLFDHIGGPLTAVLRSGRWLTARIGQEYRELFTNAFHALAAASPHRPITYNEVVYACAADIFGTDTAMSRLIAEYAATWSTVLGLDVATPETHEIRFSAAEFDELTTKAFGDARPGWTQAHLASIDLQVAAPDLESIAAGDYQVVLGEAHLSWNAIESATLIEACPYPEELVELAQAGLPGPRIALVPVKAYPRISARTVSALDDADWHLSVTDDPGRPLDRQVALAELFVEMVDGKLCVRTYDRRLWMDPIDACGLQMAEDVTDAFKHVTRDLTHCPRVVVDKLVLLRESWTAPASDLHSVEPRSEADNFFHARRWARRWGLPRFVFASVPGEAKPFYVDFASSILVASLISTIRNAVDTHTEDIRVTFSEMLPAPGQQWLPDARGHRYTSEIRLQLVDPAQPGDPGRVWTPVAPVG